MRNRLELDLEVEAEGEVEVEVEYVVPCACWRPYHTATLSDGQVALRCDACVWQRTGEDWTEAELLFSTQRPSLGSRPPRLSTDELAVQHKPDSVVVETREQVIQTIGLGSSGGPADARLPGVDDGGEVLCLRSAAPATVPSDGRPCRIELFSAESEAECTLVALPELAERAFAKSTQANRAEAPLLAGPVDLVRRGGLVGRTSIGFVAAGERFELGWGPEGEVRIQRDEEETEPEGGLLSGWLTEQHEVRLRIGNLGARQRRVRVTERVPVSEVEQVRIEVDAKATTGGQEPDEDGLIAWDVDLPPLGREELTLRWTLRRKKDVAGL